MAVAKKKKEPKGVEAKDGLLDIPVQFGGLSLGESTFRLGFKIDRKLMKDIRLADRLFCNRRLTGKLALNGSNDSPGQKLMWDDMARVISGSFDIHRFGVTEDFFTAGATFKAKEVDLTTIVEFRKGSGRLYVEDEGAIPEGEIVDEHPNKDDFGDRPLMQSDVEWRGKPVESLFAGKILKAFQRHGLDTMGSVVDFQADSGQSWGNIKGITEDDARLIETTLSKFFQDGGESEE